MSRRARLRFGLRMLIVTTMAAAVLTSDPVAAASGPRILCLGDSLTEGYQVEPSRAWPSLVASRLRENGWSGIEVVNAGISGSTSAGAVSRLAWHLRARPDVVVLALGANDGLRGIDPDVTRRNLGEAIDLALAEGIVVLLGGMKMPPNYGDEYTAAFEKVFVDLAREKGVAHIPFLLDGVAAEPAFNLPDGYERVADNVMAHLLPLLERWRAAQASSDAALPAAQPGLE